MRTWQRIILVSFVLIGGAASFGYWSINQFNSVFDELSVSDIANTVVVFSSKKEVENVPALSETSATSTPEVVFDLTATTTPEILASDIEFIFTFPQKDTEVYIGCTYIVSWQSSTEISSLETVLVDSGTKEVAGSIASGLAKENKIESDSQNLNWKVGDIWPGSYYIKTSKINDEKVGFVSKVFEINKMSESISTGEKEKVCKGSGGFF